MGLFDRLFGRDKKDQKGNSDKDKQSNSTSSESNSTSSKQKEQKQSNETNETSSNETKSSGSSKHEETKQTTSSSSSSTTEKREEAKTQKENTTGSSSSSGDSGDGKGRSGKPGKISFPEVVVKPTLDSMNPDFGGFFVIAEQGVWRSRMSMDEDGVKHLRPVSRLTVEVTKCFREINPKFSFKPKYTPPKRVLTNPSIPRHNEGADNENYDLIMHAGDVLGSDVAESQSDLCWKKGSRYTLIEMLGQGTFGQVIKCRDEETGNLVAVKVLKNKPAYFKQGLLEIGVLTIMNTNADPTGEKHTLRLLDHFMYKNHLCIVNELLGMNLYEMVKHGGFKGLNIKLIRLYLRQILDALIATDQAGIIHCDMKPENILVQKGGSGTDVTLIDFGSACFDGHSMYSYIQSRHYRAPEVILGLRYTTAIDMWSLGCIAAELLIGIPIMPGANEYNQLYKIIEMVGFPPKEIISVGTRSAKFFRPSARSGGYALKSMGEYERETGVHVDPDKKYFVFRNLSELVMKCRIRIGCTEEEASEPIWNEKEIRRSLLNFIQGCLQLDPTQRWTADQARQHPFITGELLPEGGWTPPPPLKKPIPNQPPEKRPPATSSRTPLNVNSYYSKFLSAMRERHEILDVANSIVLSTLAENLIPAPSEIIRRPVLQVRGNKASLVPSSPSKRKSPDRTKSPTKPSSSSFSVVPPPEVSSPSSPKGPVPTADDLSPTETPGSVPFSVVVPSGGSGGSGSSRYAVPSSGSRRAGPAVLGLKSDGAAGTEHISASISDVASASKLAQRMQNKRSDREESGVGSTLSKQDKEVGRSGRRGGQAGGYSGLPESSESEGREDEEDEESSDSSSSSSSETEGLSSGGEGQFELDMDSGSEKKSKKKSRRSSSRKRRGSNARSGSAHHHHHHKEDKDKDKDKEKGKIGIPMSGTKKSSIVNEVAIPASWSHRPSGMDGIPKQRPQPPDIGEEASCEDTPRKKGTSKRHERKGSGARKESDMPLLGGGGGDDREREKDKAPMSPSSPIARGVCLTYGDDDDDEEGNGTDPFALDM